MGTCLLSVLTLVTVTSAFDVAAGTLYAVVGFHLGDSCVDNIPYQVYVRENAECIGDSCSVTTLGSNVFTSDMTALECASDGDYLPAMREMFSGSSYVIRSAFADENCTTFQNSYGFPATGACVGAYNESESYHYKGTLHGNGSASVSIFDERSCLSSNLTVTYKVDHDALGSHACVPSGTANEWSRWYSSKDDSARNSSATGDESAGGLSGFAIAAIIVGAFIAIAIVVTVFICRRKTKTKRAKSETSSFQARDSGYAELWRDEVIVAKRIPREKVHVEKCISRGAFGEVYIGAFNRQKVAVKMLLPSTRGNLQAVNAFLGEAKMTATMDHPHIVRFVGVAWDALSDLCVVLEFMDAGDLRSHLDELESSGHPIGFDRHKASIALQVCHVLAYLHSLSPPVIHRDLKSRNILLDRAVTAKLTDFGISREQLNRSMTAAVGTSMWMAPEVMLGEKYDDKADMFSFGVVLSELDVHSMPYARVKGEHYEVEGRDLPEATLFQGVAMGTIRVSFSDVSPRSLRELGRACTSVQPAERPSAAEALYRLQVMLAQLK